MAMCYTHTPVPLILRTYLWCRIDTGHFRCLPHHGSGVHLYGAYDHLYGPYDQHMSLVAICWQLSVMTRKSYLFVVSALTIMCKCCLNQIMNLYKGSSLFLIAHHFFLSHARSMQNRAANPPNFHGSLLILRPVLRCTIWQCKLPIFHTYVLNSSIRPRFAVIRPMSLPARRCRAAATTADPHVLTSEA